jgi:hypothetical protein
MAPRPRSRSMHSFRPDSNTLLTSQRLLGSRWAGVVMQSRKVLVLQRTDYASNQVQVDRWSRGWLDEKSMTCSNLDEVRRISLSCDYARTSRRPGRNSSKLAGSLVGTKVGGIGCDELWNSQAQPNCREYDLLEIGRSHLGNPGIVVGGETRFLLQGMNLALHSRHLVV